MANSFTHQPDHHDGLPPYLSDPARNSPLLREPENPLKPFYPGQPKSLSGIAMRAFCLGIVFSASIIGTVSILIFTESPIWRIPFFLLSLSAFHFLEFWTTAEKNTAVATIDSFLLTANWPSYAIAHSAAFIECLVVTVFFPNRHWAPFNSGHLLLFIGLFLVAVGQAIRSIAMLHAGASFNHYVQTKKAQTHLLVTTGIYGWLRHPGYFGFFYWGLGTQLVLGNAICFMAYAAVLYMFFKGRIEMEEEKLVQFFGDDYVAYRKRVGTLIPFIK